MLLPKSLVRFKYFNRVKFPIKVKPEVQEASERLSRDGYLKIDNFLSGQALTDCQAAVENSLRNGAFEMPCLGQKLIDPVKHKAIIDSHFLASPQQYLKSGIAFDRKDFKNLDQVIKDFSPSTIKVNLQDATLAFLQPLLHDFIMDVAEHYFALKPYLIEGYARRNFPASYKVMNHFWHRDTNSKYFLLKAFVFLSDCNIKNGPHQYVAGSHRDDTLRDKTYYEDHEVSAIHAERITTSIVKAGTLILEDTRGLHKACVPEEGSRDLLYGVYMPLPIVRRNKQGTYTVDKTLAAKNLTKRQMS